MAEKLPQDAEGQSLGLLYSPAIVLSNPEGKEITRIDSLIQFYRLRGVLDYVNRRVYDQGTDYQGRRLQQRRILN